MFWRLSNFFHNKFLVAVFALSAVVLVIAFILISVNLGESERPLIVHFDVYRGIDFFGTRYDVFNILFIALGVLLINFILAVSLFERERILSYFLAIASFIFSFLVLVALAAIISVN